MVYDIMILAYKLDSWSYYASIMHTLKLGLQLGIHANGVAACILRYLDSILVRLNRRLSMW